MRAFFTLMSLSVFIPACDSMLDSEPEGEQTTTGEVAASLVAEKADGAAGPIVAGPGPRQVWVEFPASAYTTQRWGIVRWRVTSEDGSPDEEVLGIKENGRAGYHSILWTSSNGRWLNFQNLAPHGPSLSMTLEGTPQLVLQPTWQEQPWKWQEEIDINEALDADREAYTPGTLRASCAGHAFEFAGTAIVTGLASLAAPEACGATAGLGCEAAFAAAAWGWYQTAQAYSSYLSCLGF